jgi:NAD(P)-dependent dehydrogenase (short-subunit alcohol dehydrogenase family)
MQIANAATIVTGGASGLGAATARLLAEQGARVAIFDSNEEAGRRLATQIGGTMHKVNVTQEDSVSEALSAAEAAHGIARILVNCAGIAPIAETVSDDGIPHSAQLLRRVIEVNLVGTLIVLARFAARLVTEKPDGAERGVIVNTASIAAYDGEARMTAYAASKAGVVGLTLPAARDLAPHAIRVMTIAPGMFRTPMVDMLSDEAKNAMGGRVPFPNRLGSPDEFAKLVASIIGNPMLNGEVIRLDGAYRLGT